MRPIVGWAWIGTLGVTLASILIDNRYSAFLDQPFRHSLVQMTSAPWKQWYNILVAKGVM